MKILKTIKSYMILILCLVILEVYCGSLLVYAGDLILGVSYQTLRLDLILDLSCSITISTSGTATVSSRTVARSRSTNLELAIDLQRFVNGRWITLVSYHSMGSGLTNLRETYELDNKGDYRIVATATADGTENTQTIDYATY